MATKDFEQTGRWPHYVASAYLRRIMIDTGDFNPGKGSRIYRRYGYTIDAVRSLNERSYGIMRQR
jgi:hypothetical protein